jgi:hypothetical protein
VVQCSNCILYALLRNIWKGQIRDPMNIIALTLFPALYTVNMVFTKQTIKYIRFFPLHFSQNMNGKRIINIITSKNYWNLFQKGKWPIVSMIYWYWYGILLRIFLLCMWSKSSIQIFKMTMYIMCLATQQWLYWIVLFLAMER